ncbi:acyl-CoA dehydrogenase family protein [Haliangium ochraceum]|uniref:Acyl-CoA dehydrogenase domain protein n=1 Tax=Haliangium ochraceum (strain DSM 14365 / JCM 11303 / SMP-2) TaxID=502025 RepID=D0LWW5_HALO1|nr:acyl-CoA dehydrogenase family protein [Haliangium ochraceum]ACY14212.1 acyl-CoA dehydrogenase domain protein [Haliangium ochraceum DSM 14365]
MTESGKSDTAEQAEFRDHCRAWLREHLPPPPRFRLPQGPLEISTPEQLDYLCTWQRRAFEAGLVGSDYPEAYGGGGRRDCQRIANHEMQAAAAPFLPNVVGLGMAGPTIYHYGTEEQKRTLLPPLLAGEEIWCQGFSEPNAGSDLANVQTFARREGNRWIINGHKVWTSLAHFATWMILLCRTDKGDKYGGLSYFVVPIRAAFDRGVSLRPLLKMTGEGGFNEVLFEDLEVDDSALLGDVGQGWKVAMTTLLHERGAGPLVTPMSGGRMSEEADTLSAAGLVELARRSHRGGRTAADEPVLRDAIVKILIRQQGFLDTEQRAQVAALNDQPMRLALQHKVLLSELLQDTARLACEIEGMASSLDLADENAPAGGQWPLAYMNSYGFTIAAGSNEVQRNILGERVLGLAKSK